MFALSDRQYRRWLKLEARERRNPAEQAELRCYLAAITAAEDQVRGWVLEYLRAEHERHQHQGCGAERAEIYRAVAPRLPVRWAARQIARLYGACRTSDDLSAGKLLILEEALESLCSRGQVESQPGPAGGTTFLWSEAAETPAGAAEQQPARTRPQPGRHETGPAPAASRSSAATTTRPDRWTLLGLLNGFVGFDE